ncbi:uncharacterized protein BDW47DRAFT_81047 [Aspergillus candidus]|uniref:Uncharacterized protein n=1 Tax=Aspergillus candidus TaxID=41067 RepID=A0A2I2FJ59_ASPCN|nr:hypothetical protein BDW47DRAFT_81047 [Aspergillus candidus]PLB40659.1 hypothetical protein BDW47DRAFT_81047 [Aspergillus candidus]
MSILLSYYHPRLCFRDARAMLSPAFVFLFWFFAFSALSLLILHCFCCYTTLPTYCIPTYDINVEEEPKGHRDIILDR